MDNSFIFVLFIFICVYVFFFIYLFNPFPNDNFLDPSKLKGFADDDFKFDENGRKFFKQVENTVGKGENARYELFLLFPPVFSKALYCRHVKTRTCLGKG